MPRPRGSGTSCSTGRWNGFARAERSCHCRACIAGVRTVLGMGRVRGGRLGRGLKSKEGQPFTRDPVGGGDAGIVAGGTTGGQGTPRFLKSQEGSHLLPFRIAHRVLIETLESRTTQDRGHFS